MHNTHRMTPVGEGPLLTRSKLLSVVALSQQKQELSRACGTSPRQCPAGRLSNTCQSEHSSTAYLCDPVRRSRLRLLAYGAWQVPLPIPPARRDDLSPC